MVWSGVATRLDIKTSKADGSGGDGLVAARHLAQYGYKPTVYYPKEGKNELYQVRFIHRPRNIKF